MAKQAQSVGIPVLRIRTKVEDRQTSEAIEELRYQTEAALRQLVQQIDIARGLRGPASGDAS
jgi:hypothetical protein